MILQDLAKNKSRNRLKSETVDKLLKVALNAHLINIHGMTQFFFG
jgi:hypothetical protein